MIFDKNRVIINYSDHITNKKARKLLFSSVIHQLLMQLSMQLWLDTILGIVYLILDWQNAFLYISLKVEIAVLLS